MDRIQGYQHRLVPRTEWIRDVIREYDLEPGQPILISVQPPTDKLIKKFKGPITEDCLFFLKLATDDGDDRLTRHRPGGASSARILVDL